MLKTCGKQHCQPLEQVRGNMGPGDYHDVIAANRVLMQGGVPEPEKYGYPVYPGQEIPADRHSKHCVEMDESTKDDFRICCATCGKATRWGASDIPGMPGAGADWTRKFWNDGQADAPVSKAG